MRQSMQLFTLLTAAWLLSVPAANAQAQFPSPGTSEQMPNITDQKVASVRENYQQRIEAAPASDKQTIADEAKNALVKAITDQGVSVDEYRSILVVAQNDPKVREKIVQRIRPPAK
jgi:hypothetical protein